MHLGTASEMLQKLQAVYFGLFGNQYSLGNGTYEHRGNSKAAALGYYFVLVTRY